MENSNIPNIYSAVCSIF